MKNLRSTADFERSGGTEPAPMSTTSDIHVAVAYALSTSLSTSSLIFQLVADAFMCRGADISFLSAFPAEHEFVYPPLTYMQPTGRRELIRIAQGEAGEGSPEAEVTIIEVEPHVV